MMHIFQVLINAARDPGAAGLADRPPTPSPAAVSAAVSGGPRLLPLRPQLRAVAHKLGTRTRGAQG